MLFFSMRFDLHVHSRFSKDSNADIDSIITHAKKNGLDGIAVCDHDTIEGGIACAKRAKEIGTDLIVISGVEVTSSKGHILVIGIKENIEPQLSPEKTIERARELGGVVVEVLNSRCLGNSSNSKAKKAAESQNLPQVGGSDAHTPQMVGQAYTEIDAQENTVDAVLMAIRQGKVRAGGKKTPISLVIKQMFVGFGRKTIRQL
jgi:predicted metal-dependent phosphoesterase TrpH